MDVASTLSWQGLEVHGLSVDELIAFQNDVSEGLSMRIFVDDVREARTPKLLVGSSFAIANVRPSRADFGSILDSGKATRGRCEIGTGVVKAHMRWVTAGVNYSGDPPLIQDVEFGGG